MLLRFPKLEKVHVLLGNCEIKGKRTSKIESIMNHLQKKHYNIFG